MGLGGGGGIITQERRTRPAPTSHETERRRREAMLLSVALTKSKCWTARERKNFCMTLITPITTFYSRKFFHCNHPNSIYIYYIYI